MKNFIVWIKNNPWKLIFWLFLIIALCTSIRLCLDAGFSGDEEFQMKQAKAVYDLCHRGKRHGCHRRSSRLEPASLRTNGG